MENTDPLKEFYGRRARLLIDARCVQCEGTVSSLDALAEISYEQDPQSGFIKLNSIKYNIGICSEDAVEYGRGAIQKKYIIGIFVDGKE